MNKLYKYLPFNIKVRYKDKDWIFTGYYKEKNSYKVQLTLDNKTISADIDDVIPILRPMSDIKKHVRLTPFSAKMIYMKEGDFIIPIKYLSTSKQIEQEFFGRIFDIVSEEELDFLRSLHFAVDNFNFIKLEEL